MVGESEMPAVSEATTRTEKFVSLGSSDRGSIGVSQVAKQCDR